MAYEDVLNPEMAGHFLTTYILPNTPDCDSFRKNIGTLSSKYFERLEVQFSDPNDLSHSNNMKFHINLYQNVQSEILDDFAITQNASQVIDRLESAATEYLVTTVTKSFGIASLENLNKLRNIEVLSKKLSSALDEIEFPSNPAVGLAFSIDDFLGFFQSVKIVATTDAKTSPEEIKKRSNDLVSQLYFSRVIALQKELEWFSSIYTKLTETFLGKWLQVGVRGPKQNSGLDDWIVALADCWVVVIGRSFTDKDDKHGGREQFLRFAEACMIPLHPTIGADADTIRNAFEKLKKRGALDYLSQKSD